MVLCAVCSNSRKVPLVALLNNAYSVSVLCCPILKEIVIVLYARLSIKLLEASLSWEGHRVLAWLFNLSLWNCFTQGWLTEKGFLGPREQSFIAWRWCNVFFNPRRSDFVQWSMNEFNVRDSAHLYSLLHFPIIVIL